MLHLLSDDQLLGLTGFRQQLIQTFGRQNPASLR